MSSRLLYTSASNLSWGGFYLHLLWAGATHYLGVCRTLTTLVVRYCIRLFLVFKCTGRGDRLLAAAVKTVWTGSNNPWTHIENVGEDALSRASLADCVEHLREARHRNSTHIGSFVGTICTPQAWTRFSIGTGTVDEFSGLSECLRNLFYNAGSLPKADCLRMVATKAFVQISINTSVAIHSTHWSEIFW